MTYSSLSSPIGPELLTSAARTSLSLPLSSTLPPYLSCSIPSYVSNASPIHTPTHVLAVASSDSNQILLLPVHGLLFASISPLLSILSSKVESQPFHPSLPLSLPPFLRKPTIKLESIEGEERIQLPVVQITLPSSKSFPLLQSFIYTRSSTLLLSSLLPSPTSFSKASLFSILTPTAASLSHTFSQQSSSLLLTKIHLVHGLWQNVVALEIGEDGSVMGKELWNVLRNAWLILVGALAIREAERKRRKVMDDMVMSS